MRAEELFQNCIAFCQNRGIEISRFELYLLLEEFTGISRARFPLERDREMPERAQARLMEALERRGQGEPVQYLLGRWEFYGRSFRVGEGVLIPRADTETLVEHALEQLRGKPAPAVADLCAGSGCVGLTIGLERPDARVFLAELSPLAMGYLKENLCGLGAANCTALQGDVLAWKAPLPPLDLIVSNPPYIPTGEISGLQREVQREPALALDGDEDGLRFYREIPKAWGRALKPGGMLAFEVGLGQAEAVADMLCQNGYGEICFREDLAGIRRVVSGLWSGEERR
ncbi:MAG: peptide chain release factor N(5)-glutamine methyltransferase [Oscillospiraceae bacterium]|nr:peptide chain release factor N(5)-glutamine methyltransferase [Oscillospiraceae bacterium]